MACSERNLVTFADGFVADMTIVTRLIDLEARGLVLELMPAGRFRAVPPDLLTGDDVAFLRAHRDEARMCLEYIEQMANGTVIS